jgi:acyl carrier protein
MTLTADSLLGFLQSQLGLDTASITPESPLFTSGFIDSFSLIDLIMFVESQVGTKIEPDEVQIDNFDTINRIIKFAEAKKGS